MSTLITEPMPWTAKVQTPCRVFDPELWFADDPEQVAQAQSLCGQCPLQVACLSGALERREPWGVWGGELFEDGAPVARKRRPGRPRKDDDLARHAAEQALAARLTQYAQAAPHSDLDLELDLLVACTAEESTDAGPRGGGVAV
jgi:WhiB family redox-sensing transcriptional regulator